MRKHVVDRAWQGNTFQLQKNIFGNALKTMSGKLRGIASRHKRHGAKSAHTGLQRKNKKQYLQI